VCSNPTFFLENFSFFAFFHSPKRAPRSKNEASKKTSSIENKALKQLASKKEVSMLRMRIIISCCIFHITSLSGNVNARNRVTPPDLGSRSVEEIRMLRPPFQWIHPQKTGSTFANALFALTCPEQVQGLTRTDSLNNFSIPNAQPNVGIRGISKTCRSKWHMEKFEKVIGRKTRPQWIIGEHYTWSKKVQPSSTFVTLRSPMRRIMSLVEWRFGLCTPKTLKMMMLRRRKGPWNSYMDYLTGGGKNSEEIRISLAHQRLSQVAWIGLTEYFDASLCLLHSMYPHTPHPLEKVNMRKTVYKSKNGTKDWCSPRVLERKYGFSHRYDTEIYIYAVEVFSQMIIKYGPACARAISAVSSYEPEQARKILENLRDGIGSPGKVTYKSPSV